MNKSQVDAQGIAIRVLIALLLELFSLEALNEIRDLGHVDRVDIVLVIDDCLTIGYRLV